jgi:hypothetical protein
MHWTNRQGWALTSFTRLESAGRASLSALPVIQVADLHVKLPIFGHLVSVGQKTRAYADNAEIDI